VAEHSLSPYLRLIRFRIEDLWVHPCSSPLDSLTLIQLSVFMHPVKLLQFDVSHKTLYEALHRKGGRLFTFEWLAIVYNWSLLSIHVRIFESLHKSGGWNESFATTSIVVLR